MAGILDLLGASAESEGVKVGDEGPVRVGNPIDVDLIRTT